MNNNWTDNTFLSHVAKDLLMRFKDDMSRVTVVFPNKRARLFMNEVLLSEVSNTCWAPHYSTIAEMFESIVGDTVAETIPAVCKLYYVYKQLMGEKAESLDVFWGWGEILLSDFDDIDKHLVNADNLFLNAKELNDIESFDFLSPNQREALERFFGAFATENKTHLQERFSELWSIMPGLYHGLKEAMPEGVQPYQGALERLAVENKDMLALLDEERTYCFVGFNMLSETEKKLMTYLNKKNKALFYWDYDDMYKDNPTFEAGDFIRKNLEDYPNALSKRKIYDNLAHKAGFTFVSTSTDSIATRYIPQWLTAKLTETERETALVLCDEQQLQPVLHAIPDKGNTSNEKAPKDINITMGYSLMGTPIYSLTSALITLQTEGWDKKRKRFSLPFLRTIKYHPYYQYIADIDWERRIEPTHVAELIQYLDEIVISLAGKMSEEDSDFDDVLMTESLYIIHKTLRQFYDMVTNNEHPLVLQPSTIRRLLRRVLGSKSIPFHGEPAQGLQVMGVLETRCLDFKNILMLNVGEGFLPKNTTDNSLIPFTLRTGFGLTTIRHKVAVFAYYFYRLIQRAEHVTFIFNENSSGNVRREISRFLRQLQAETDIPIDFIRLEAEQYTTQIELKDIDKDEDTVNLLHQKFNLKESNEAYTLSPSSINRYINCPMQFYLTSVCGLRVQPDEEEVVDARILGNIFHNAAEEIYKEIMSHSKSKIITRAQLSEYTANKGERLQPIIDKHFRKEANITEFRGENILIRGVVERYLINLLKWDERHSPISMEAMEKDVAMQLNLKIGERDLCIKTGGRVDRMDIISDGSTPKHLRIVDYKTGAHENEVKKMDDIFKRSSKHAGYYLQTFLYAIAASKNYSNQLPIKPVLFYTAKSGKEDYDPSLYIGNSKGANKEGLVSDILAYENDFMEQLKGIITEIFNPEVPFYKTKEPEACAFCDFKQLCNRQGEKNF